MKRIYRIGLLVLVLVPVLFSQGLAAVEWNIQRTLNLTEPPLDVAVSLSGRWVFVLTESGDVHIYTPEGRLEGTLHVGRRVDQIRVGPREDLLLLTSREEKTVQIMTLDFIRPINVSGSPFKGPEDAPVVIAVFSDFE
jgi:hypothetical protein